MPSLRVLEVVLLRPWYYAMGRLVVLWLDSVAKSFALEVVGGRAIGSSTVCGEEGVSCYLLLSFSFVQEWEQRILVSWLVNTWCCMLGDHSPLGLKWEVLQQIVGLLHSGSGVGFVVIKPVLLRVRNKTIIDVRERVMGGTEVYTVFSCETMFEWMLGRFIDILICTNWIQKPLRATCEP